MTEPFRVEEWRHTDGRILIIGRTAKCAYWPPGYDGHAQRRRVPRNSGPVQLPEGATYAIADRDDVPADRWFGRPEDDEGWTLWAEHRAGAKPAEGLS